MLVDSMNDGKKMKISTKESRDSNIIAGAAQITCGLVLASLLACTGSIAAAVS
ncbi:unnamed protein product, partial [marine sediment metagenome]